LLAKKNWDRKQDKGSTVMLAMYCCGWQKGTSWDKEMLSSEEINSLVLSIVQLCLAKGIR